MRNRKSTFTLPLGLLLSAALLASLACSSAAPSGTGEAASAPVAKQAEDLLIVDCLLPPTVKKLGTSVTYLSARRPVKTSAVDCEIRGGEYVAYDRGSYATALRVWLPLAQQGDPQAQNYVGEIYEKGLGILPDYQIAAAWYRRAAEQGHSPAQINLGQLYEHGLGVSQDSRVAFDWYRRASGLEELGIEFVSDGPASLEVVGLKSELSATHAEVEGLREQLQALQTDVDESSLTRREMLREMTSERERFAAARQALEADRLALASERERLAGDRTWLADARSFLADREVAFEALAASVVDDETALASRRRELDERAADLTTVKLERAALEASRAELAAARAELETTASRVATSRQALAHEESAVAASRTELESRLETVSESEALIAERHLALEGRESEVAGLASSTAARRSEIAELDGEIETLREELAIRRAEVAEASAMVVALAGPSIQVIDPAIPSTRALEVVVASSSAEERVVVGRVTAPAGLHTFTVNERATKVDENGLFRVHIPVRSGGSPVSIVAIDRKGKRADRRFRLELDPDGLPAVAAAPRTPRIDFGRYYAIVIGNNEYPKLPDLESAIPDAHAVSSTLRERYGFEVTLLENATRYEILSALNEHRARLTEKDNLLLYYAGHGELDRVNNRGHWLPVDADAENTANWISNVAITDVLNAMNARHVLVVADSCYSGALARSALARLEAGMTNEARSSWQRAMVAKRSRTALTSGGLKPILDSGGGEHSIFATVFLEVLDTNVEVLEGQRLFREVAARVTWAAEGTDFEQVPQYAPIKFAGHESGDFFFVPLVPDGLRSSSGRPNIATASR